MRLATALGACLTAGLLTTAAPGAEAPVIRVAGPSFPPPLGAVVPSGRLRLVAVSTARRAPTYTLRPGVPVPRVAPRMLTGRPAVRAFTQPGTTFVVYGETILAAIGPRAGLKYAFDLRSFGYPPRPIAPNPYGPQEVVWAHQLGRTLVVQTSHLGYAHDSANRNGYLTGIDVDTGEVRWRSPSLVANAGNFVLARGLIVSGYGFTAERDWLYLVDPATGRVRDRLALPSAAERITLQGGRVIVECYDARVVAGLVAA